MNCITSLHIEGFKKFEKIDVTFNQHLNILVGENEAGKSTILEAIRIALNQQYRNADKSILRELFNMHQVEEFEENPSINTLPRILIEIEMELDASNKNSEYFNGEEYGLIKSQEEKTGIRFECRYDEELGSGIETSISAGQIPYEYYKLSWTTFANRPYQIIKRPLNFLVIDTERNNTSSAFNYFNKALFTSKYDESTRAQAKNKFSASINNAFDQLELTSIDENRKFGIDYKKVILENILSVYDHSIALENRGSGMESLIKTKIALQKSNHLDVIMIEEPENHLSFTTLQKMIEEIKEQQNDSQIILTTHSSMIASRLKLNNVLWIAGENVVSLEDLDPQVADFFTRIDNNSFLQLLLSKKAFLVEGATENLLLPKFYESETGKSIEKDSVAIISCNGVSYKKYLAAAEKTNKKIAVLTDNDGIQKKITEAQSFNSRHNLQQIFMSENLKEWTWEVCIYNQNKQILDEMIPVEDNADYKFNDRDYGKILGKMLNNKVDIAYKMVISGKDFKAPQYVKDAIQWLNK